VSDPGWQPPEDPYGQQPPYGGQQPPYGGQQPPYGGQQVPYGQQPPYGGQPPHGGYGQPGLTPVSPSDERLWGMLAHLGQLLFAFLAPIVIYVIYRDRSQFIRHHAAQALNFAVTCLIYWTIGAVLTVITCGVGVVLLVALAVAELVFLIIAAVAANKGEWYTYPPFVAFPMFT
jgi:uncharacterized Tic20 family protein